MAHTIARVLNLVLAGMLTGNEFGSRATVHPALRDLPPAAHVQAERALTARYGRIMPAFMSATIASFVPVLALDRDRRAAPFRLTLVGLLCYAAMLGVTLTGNVPINGRLLALDPETTRREEFLALTDRWTRLHTLRNVLNVTGLTLTALGAVRRPSTRGSAASRGALG